MMAFRIALFLLILNGTFAYLTDTGLFDYQRSTLDIGADEIKTDLPDTNVYSQSTITTFIFGDFPRMIGLFVKILGYSTILLPLMLLNVGLPNSIVGLITLVVWVFYAVGAIEFIANRNLRGGV
jgi:hypothetical protein